MLQYQSPRPPSTAPLIVGGAFLAAGAATLLLTALPANAWLRLFLVSVGYLMAYMISLWIFRVPAWRTVSDAVAAWYVGRQNRP